MKLPANPFLAAIRAGRPQIGLWSSLGQAFAAEIVAGAGYDWVLIDMEHSPNDYATVMAQLQVYAAYDTVPIVRPDWNDTVKVKRLLDVGAPGLLFPMVQDTEGADRAVRAMRYPPRGVRGMAGTTRASGFGRISDYFTRIEDETAALLQVETVAALAHAEAIADQDGVDGIFFGPNDIATDMGHMAQPMHPDVWEVILPIAKRLIARGVPVGTLVMDPEFCKRLIGDGFSFVACGSDAGLLARSADALLQKMREN